MFDPVRQACQNYYDQIPSDTIPKIVKSALYTFTATLILSRADLANRTVDLARPLLAAGVAAFASLIYALTSPIFNMAFGDNHIVFHREFIKCLATVSLTSLIVHSLTTSKVNSLSIHLITGITINLLKSIPAIIPDMIDWFDGPGQADELRKGFCWLGIDAPPGSSSIFFSMGNGFLV